MGTDFSIAKNKTILMHPEKTKKLGALPEICSGGTGSGKGRCSPVGNEGRKIDLFPYETLHHLSQGCSPCNVRMHHLGLVKIQILIQKIWNQKSALLRSSQVMLALLAHGAHFE